MWSNTSTTWDHEVPGTVTDVHKTKRGWKIAIKTYQPAQEADKLANRYGGKGVISKIIPDDQMPHDKEGNPFDILLNPLGVISRGNPAQLIETALGKVARKRGKAYRLPGFMDESFLDLAKRELQREGLSDTEDLFDPTTGRKIPNVFTGEQFTLKLHHLSESKVSGRGDTGAYSAEDTPARGGKTGSKRLSTMGINALISHGATEVLRDAQVVRGQRNDDFWRAFRLGYSPPSPRVPLIYQKFMAYLQGAGVSLNKSGNQTQIFAMTDDDVDKLSSGPLKSADTVRADNLRGMPGGLFDPGMTGSHGGNRWTHIDLSAPMPNPVMEEPIRRILGLTKQEYYNLIKEKGGAGIRQQLATIDLDREIEANQQMVRSGPRSKRDLAVKRLGYLMSMKEMGIMPDKFVMSKVPVLPPIFRPISSMKEMTLVADPNFLYQDLWHANNDLAELSESLSDHDLGDERLRLYNAFKAITGLGDPVGAKSQEKNVRGLLAHVFGGTPKAGMFQRRVLGTPVDIVGRAVITPNPSLDMDHVGLPEKIAWNVYQPFIVRRLIRAGMPAVGAAHAVANKTEPARKALLAETKARPVLINRAPTLHRYGMMAAFPILTKGNTLQISPVMTPGFGADFDGDQMNFHVPVTDEAVQEAISKMLPSTNLYAVQDFGVHLIPKQEFLLGLYLASRGKSKKQPRIFNLPTDVIRAYNRGEVQLTDPVTVMKGRER
jgi:hypothetical protein